MTAAIPTLLVLLVTAAPSTPQDPSTTVASTPSQIRAIQRPRDRPANEVVLPAQAMAGGRLSGQVPPGSSVDAGGVAVAVASDGRIDWEIPADAHGTLALRILRPDGRRLRVNVRITPAR